MAKEIYEEKIINAFLYEKKHYAEIKKEFNVSAKTIREILHKNGIFPKSGHDMLVTDEIIIDEYVNKEKTLLQIQSELHTNRPYLEKVLFAHGIKLRPRVTIKIGDKFNNLTVIERLENQKQHPMFLCRCDCGKTRKVLGQNLKSGRVKDCGCISQKLRSLHISQHSSLKTHGLSKTRMYTIWSGMKDRCSRKNNKNYSLYGGRGIKVCDEWSNDFLAFRNWALDNGYKDNLSIDRIDPNGNYEPDNCRWITLTEQTYNKRNSRKIFHKGIGKTAREWSNILNCSPYALYEYAKEHDWQLEPFLNFKNLSLPEGAANE